jgi:hypothetical protein
MRRIMAACLIAMGTLLAGAPAQAYWFDIDTVPALKGNDTGGIIAFDLASQYDARQIAVKHCAKYGKVAKFLAVDPQEGGYVSFACRWVPYGSLDRPISSAY